MKQKEPCWVSLKIEGYLDDDSPKPVWKFIRQVIKLGKVPDLISKQMKLAIKKDCKAFIVEIGDPYGKKSQALIREPKMGEGAEA